MSVYQSNLLAMMDPSYGYNINPRTAYTSLLARGQETANKKDADRAYQLKVEELQRVKENDEYLRKYGLFNQGKGTQQERVSFMEPQGFSSEAYYRDPDTGFDYYGDEAKKAKDPAADFSELQAMMGEYQKLQPYSWAQKGGAGYGPMRTNPQYDPILAGVYGSLGGRMSKLSRRL